MRLLAIEQTRSPQGKLRLRCENPMVGVVLDRFGQDVMLVPDGESHFTVTVDAVVSPQFFGWLFGLDGGLVLTGPRQAVEAYRQRLSAAAELCF